MNAILPIGFNDRIPAEEADEYIVTIGNFGEASDNTIELQSFIDGGQEYIPVFSGIDQFLLETKGSEFGSKGILIRKDLLSTILRGDELVIINPGSEFPIRLKASDLL